MVRLLWMGRHRHRSSRPRKWGRFERHCQCNSAQSVRWPWLRHQVNVSMLKRPYRCSSKTLFPRQGWYLAPRSLRDRPVDFRRHLGGRLPGLIHWRFVMILMIPKIQITGLVLKTLTTEQAATILTIELVLKTLMTHCLPPFLHLNRWKTRLCHHTRQQTRKGTQGPSLILFLISLYPPNWPFLCLHLSDKWGM